MYTAHHRLALFSFGFLCRREREGRYEKRVAWLTKMQIKSCTKYESMNKDLSAGNKHRGFTYFFTTIENMEWRVLQRTWFCVLLHKDIHMVIDCKSITVSS